MPTESPPASLRSEIEDVAQDLDYLTHDCGPEVVDKHLAASVARLRAVAAAMPESDPGLSRVGPDAPLLALQDGAGRLLWARNNHGTWPAERGQDVQLFEGEEHFRHWLDQKPGGYADKLAADGYRLVEYLAFTRPHQPAVAEACVGAAEGGAA